MHADLAAARQGARCGAVRHALELLAAPVAIPFDVHHDRIPETEAVVDQDGEQILERLERLAVASDQDGEVGVAHVEDKLAFAAFVLVDVGIVGAEEPEHVAQDFNRRIGNEVKLVVVQVLVGLVLAGDFDKLLGDHLGGNLCLGGLFGVVSVVGGLLPFICGLLVVKAVLEPLELFFRHCIHLQSWPYMHVSRPIVSRETLGRLENLQISNV